MLTRRALLRGGIAAGVVVGLAGLIYEFRPDHAGDDPHYHFTMLSDEDRVIIAALAPVMLAGALPADPASQRNAVLQVVEGADLAIAGLPLEVRKQLRQLFGLLRFPLTRVVAAGIWRPWHEASPGEVAYFLSAWRRSPIARLRSGYDALHQLVMASWYGNSAAWKATGYPGPPTVA